MNRHLAPTSGGVIAYDDVGGGPAVVLLHGFPQSAHVWRDIGPMLASRFRVIAPDLIGLGDSDKPEDVALGVLAQAGYVRELLATLDVERFAVVGHGIGGGIAQLLAMDHAGVDALVLIDSVAFDDWPSAATRELQRTPPNEEVELLVHSRIRAELRAGMGRPERLGEEHVAVYLRPFTGESGVAAFFRFARALDGFGLTGRDSDLARLDVPALIFWGEDDAFLPVGIAERLNEAIPTSTLGIVPGCGHFLVDDAAETIGPMIYEYLRARYLQEPHGHGDASGVVAIQLERRPPWVDLVDDELDERDAATREEGER